MKCPNKKCNSYGKVIENITQRGNYNNYICQFCKCHYDGLGNDLKFYTEQEWDKMIEEYWQENLNIIKQSGK